MVTELINNRFKRQWPSVTIIILWKEIKPAKYSDNRTFSFVTLTAWIVATTSLLAVGTNSALQKFSTGIFY